MDNKASPPEAALRELMSLGLVRIRVTVELELTELDIYKTIVEQAEERIHQQFGAFGRLIGGYDIVSAKPITGFMTVIMDVMIKHAELEGLFKCGSE